MSEAVCFYTIGSRYATVSPLLQIAGVAVPSPSKFLNTVTPLNAEMNPNEKSEETSIRERESERSVGLKTSWVVRFCGKCTREVKDQCVRCADVGEGKGAAPGN